VGPNGSKKKGSPKGIMNPMIVAMAAIFQCMGVAEVGEVCFTANYKTRQYTTTQPGVVTVVNHLQLFNVTNANTGEKYRGWEEFILKTYDIGIQTETRHIHLEGKKQLVLDEIVSYGWTL
jgi:hypothetical protein